MHGLEKNKLWRLETRAAPSESTLGFEAEWILTTDATDRAHPYTPPTRRSLSDDLCSNVSVSRLRRLVCISGRVSTHEQARQSEKGQTWLKRIRGSCWIVQGCPAYDHYNSRGASFHMLLSVSVSFSISLSLFLSRLSFPMLYVLVPWRVSFTTKRVQPYTFPSGFSRESMQLFVHKLFCFILQFLCSTFVIKWRIKKRLFKYKRWSPHGIIIIRVIHELNVSFVIHIPFMYVICPYCTEYCRHIIAKLLSNIAKYCNITISLNFLNHFLKQINIKNF